MDGIYVHFDLHETTDTDNTVFRRALAARDGKSKKLSLCAGISNARYTTTTEVYPDSPKASEAICIEAQVAAIKGGLDYIKVVLKGNLS
jgi:hypothetical protein